MLARFKDKCPSTTERKAFCLANEGREEGKTHLMAFEVQLVSWLGKAVGCIQHPTLMISSWTSPLGLQQCATSKHCKLQPTLNPFIVSEQSPKMAAATSATSWTKLASPCPPAAGRPPTSPSSPHSSKVGSWFM